MTLICNDLCDSLSSSFSSPSLSPFSPQLVLLNAISDPIPRSVLDCVMKQQDLDSLFEWYVYMCVQKYIQLCMLAVVLLY